MSIQKKSPLKVKDNDVARALQKVYDDMNEIINALNLGDTTSEKSTTSGQIGSVRILKHGSGGYYLEAKTNEGWVRSDGTSATGFTFREKENL
tara:strand:- start:369 stop:647 length:279 start_codon:yes stop_codon:yes gene_type:complete